MKNVLSVMLIMLGMTLIALSEDVTLRKANGEVFVRHGVTETWTKVAVGDVLKPDDTMKTGKKGSALLVVNGTKKMMLPAEVIVDVSDIRNLSQEELMLKLTMEKVRSSSYEWKNNEMNVPNAAVVHGADRAPSVRLTENLLEVGLLEWNGTKVLFDNGYYSTSALKAMDVLRRYPPLGDKFENRLLVAQALEKANLRGEALSEYVSISQSDKLSAEQKEVVATRIAQLRKQSGE